MASGDVITGKSGSLSYGATPTVVKIINWSIKKSTSPVPVSDSGSGDFEEFAPGKRINWSGTFEKFVREGETAIPFNSVITFKGILLTGAEVSGNIIVNDMSLGVDVNNGEASKHTFSFQGTATLTEDYVTT